MLCCHSHSYANARESNKNRNGRWKFPLRFVETSRNVFFFSFSFILSFFSYSSLGFFFLFHFCSVISVEYLFSILCVSNATNAIYRRLLCRCCCCFCCCCHYTYYYLLFLFRFYFDQLLHFIPIQLNFAFGINATISRARARSHEPVNSNKLRK